MIGERFAFADSRLFITTSAAGRRNASIHLRRAIRGLSVHSLKPAPSPGLHLENNAARHDDLDGAAERILDVCDILEIGAGAVRVAPADRRGDAHKGADYRVASDRAFLNSAIAMSRSAFKPKGIPNRPNGCWEDRTRPASPQAQLSISEQHVRPVLLTARHELRVWK
jgi:hypothetical protein